MQKTSLNIIIPVYNEVKRLPLTINALHNYLISLEGIDLQTKVDVMTYIVNDGSTDETSTLAQELIGKYNLAGELISYEENIGKGNAVKYGVLNSRAADYYYLADADLSSPWSTIKQLLTIATEEEYDCVIGSRAVPGANISTSSKRLVSGRSSNLIIKTILGLSIEGTQCGYKLFAKSCLPAFSMQHLLRWGFDFELLYLLKKLNLRTKEVGIVWENKEGSKVKIQDYFRTLGELMQVRTHDYPIKLNK